MVAADDEEVAADMKIDEFSSYFERVEKPRLLLTTSKAPTSVTFDFLRELALIFPNTEYYKRGTYEMKKICKFAANRGFTNVMVVHEEKKKLTGLWLVHLPNGPTAHFKLTSIKQGHEISGHGKAVDRNPEVNLAQFSTRLGTTIGRMLASLFPPNPAFRARQVATFHNQRDFIFFRRHRYIFESAEKARLQELGPQFTLKLRSLQYGTFDTKHGEVEFMAKKENVDSRRRFFL